ncbi:MAG TPA: heme exporter protein CcmD [Steroidobacteraceae bacterium]|nr:heme exporter protein CcmD [Steroidobacteraceae bacterium]
MNALTHFLAMGGYARYLWPCYGITFAVVFLNIYWARRLIARARSEARRRIAMREEWIVEETQA